MVKLSRSTEQLGVYFESTREGVHQRVNSMDENVYVIQENFTDLDLIDGGKYNVRIYVLMTHGPRVFCCQTALIGVFPGPFHSNQFSKETHIFGGREGPLATRFTTSDKLEQIADVMEKINQDLERLFGHLSPTFQAVSDPFRYQIFGLDYLVSSAGDPILIEINDWPNIGASGRYPEDVLSYRVDMLNELFTLVLTGGN